MKKLNKILSILILMATIDIARADIRVASIFGSNMVLQQEKPIKIWGWADVSEKVSITLGKQLQCTQAGTDRKWSVTLQPLKASFQPLTMAIVGKNKIILDNILIGEVWMCSGQSNMAFGLSGAINSPQECSKANYSNIRLFTVSKNISTTPQENFSGNWEPCNPQTVAWFSAVGYFFGKDIHKNLNVPVGLISSNLGGTQIESWTPLEYLETVKSMQPKLDYDKLVLNSDFKKFNEKKKAYFEECNKIAKQAESSKMAMKYSGNNLNHDSWKTMEVPCEWGEGGLKNYDGYVWFRKIIDLPSVWAGKDIILHLGPIDETDITYFNGTEIGRSGSIVQPRNLDFWNKPRNYIVPGKLVKGGKNLVAVLMADTLREGGFRGAPQEDIFAELAITVDKDEKVFLAGKWKYYPVVQLPTMPAQTGIEDNPINQGLCSVLYNGMVNPMASFSIRGIIWYQGEANSDRPCQYRKLMPLMIKAWRDRWNDSGIVFIQTQLPNFMLRRKKPDNSNWAELREAQFMTAQKDPYGGIAVTIDVGDALDIHPRDKQSVGKRLAMQAMKIAYGQNIQFEGPVYKSMKIEKNRIRLIFGSVFDGLVAKNGKLKGFAIAGKNKKFVWADAKIDGNDVIVWSDKLPKPVAVRYAWDDNPECTLYNLAELPATPFRTDNW